MEITEMKIKALIVMTMTAAALLLPSCGKQPDKTSDANVNEPVEFGANITVSDSYAFRENDGRLYLWDLKTNSYRFSAHSPIVSIRPLQKTPIQNARLSLQKRGTFITMLFFITIRYTRYARAS